MKIVAHNKKDEKAKPLSQVATGKVVRFYSISFEEAIADDSQESFFLKTEIEKDGRIALVAISGKGTLIYRDSDFPVFEHEIIVEVKK